MAIKTVCIIGAGVSGLSSIKSCLEDELEPICFERSPGVGGLWFQITDEKKDDMNYTFDCLRTNTSKEMTCLSDFPYPDDYPPFLNPKHMQTYYELYAEHFNLIQHIRFNSRVIHAVRLDTGRWEIVAENVDNTDDVTKIEVDALIMSCGLQSVPYTPDIPGLAEFTGNVLHSQKFRSGVDYAGKTVLVVGAAFSGGDTGVDCSRHARMTYISTRRGCWVLKRTFGGGGPWDIHILTRWFNYMPECWQELYMETVQNAILNHQTLGLQSEKRLFAGGSIMLNDSVDDQIYTGKLQMKPEIKTFTKTGVLFVDGSSIENIDEVIIATGYHKSFPFFEDKTIRDQLEEWFGLYKYVFIPNEPTFAAIGFAKPLGPQAPTYELQARWTTRIFSGKLKLPSIEDMNKDIAHEKHYNLHHYGDIDVYILWSPYVLEIARTIGALPWFTSYIFKSPRIAMQLAFGAINPYIFRLQGPHAWDGAMHALLESPRRMIQGTKTRVSRVPYRTCLHTLVQVFMFVFVVFFAVLIGFKYYVNDN